MLRHSDMPQLTRSFLIIQGTQTVKQARFDTCLKTSSTMFFAVMFSICACWEPSIVPHLCRLSQPLRSLLRCNLVRFDLCFRIVVLQMTKHVPDDRSCAVETLLHDTLWRLRNDECLPEFLCCCSLKLCCSNVLQKLQQLKNLVSGIIQRLLIDTYNWYASPPCRIEWDELMLSSLWAGSSDRKQCW